MAVTFDAVGPSSSGFVVTGAVGTSFSSPQTWTHTLASNASYLLVWLAFDNTNGAPTVSVTAGGVSMAAAAANPVLNQANTQGCCYAFTLANPPTGTITISVSFTTNINIDALTGGSLSFIGAGSLGTPVVVSGVNTGTTITLTPTGVAATSMVAGFIGCGDPPVNPSTGTSRFQAQGQGSSGNSNGNAEAATNTGTGSVSVSWSTFSAGDTHCGWAVEVIASASGGPTGGVAQFSPSHLVRYRHGKSSGPRPRQAIFIPPAVSGTQYTETFLASVAAYASVQNSIGRKLAASAGVTGSLVCQIARIILATLAVFPNVTRKLIRQLAVATAIAETSGGGGGTVSVVQSTQSADFGSTATFGVGTTAGNTVFIACHTGLTGGGTISISNITLGSANATLLEATQSSAGGANTVGVALYMVANCVAGQTALSFTANNPTFAVMLAAWEVSGLGTTPSVDQFSANSATSGTAVNSGTTPAITSAPEFIYGGSTAYNGALVAQGAPWHTPTLKDGSGDAEASYQIATSSGGTYSWVQTAGNSDPWAALVVTIEGVASSGGVNSLLRNIGRILLGSIGTTGTTVHQPGKSLAGEATVTGSVTRSLGKNMLASLGVTATTVRSISRNISAVLAAASSLSLTKVKMVALAAQAAVTGTVTRSIGRLTGAQAAVTGSLTRNLGRNVSASLGVTGTLIRSLGKNIVAAVAATASVATIKVKLLTLTAVAAVTGTLPRSVTRIITTPVAVTAQTVRTIGRKLAASAAATASLLRQVGRTLTASAAVTATVVAGTAAIHNVTLLAQAAVTAVLTRSTGRNLAAQAAATSSLTRNLSTRIAASIAAAATLTRNVIRNISAPLAATATVSLLKVKLVALAAQAAMTGAVTRKVQANMLASLGVTAGITRQVARKIAASAAVTALASKTIPRIFTAVSAVTSTTSFLKVKVVLLAASLGTALGLRRQVGSHQAATAATAPSILRAISVKGLRAYAAVSPSLIAGRLHLLAIVSTVAATSGTVAKHVFTSLLNIFKLGLPFVRWITGNPRKNWRVP